MKKLLPFAIRIGIIVLFFNLVSNAQHMYRVGIQVPTTIAGVSQIAVMLLDVHLPTPSDKG